MSVTPTLQGFPSSDKELKKEVPYLFEGLPVIVEFLEGDTRTKVKSDGTTISNVMPAIYGYILFTTDVHGEGIDMYIAPNHKKGANVYIIDQVFPDNQLFDEHKIMLGFKSQDEATSTYKKVFGDGSGEHRIGAVTEMSLGTLRIWLSSEGSSLSPASLFSIDGAKITPGVGVIVPGRQAPPQPAKRDEAGGVIMTLPDTSQGPKLITSANDQGGRDYTLSILTELDPFYWSTAIDSLCRTMDLASENDVFHLRIDSPGGAVMLMGRVTSAIKRTKAKVVTYAIGQVGSAATTIWAAGQERFILPGANFMQHMSTQMLYDKTMAISAKSCFMANHIREQLEHLISIGLFTADEVQAMIDRDSDIFISGREATARGSHTHG